MAWKLLYGNYSKLENAPGAEWLVTLKDNREIDYCLRDGKPFQKAKSISVTMKLEGSCKPVESGTTAYATVMLQRKGDTLTGQGKYEQYRLWYLGQRIPLVASGTYTISVPLTKEGWTGVFAGDATNGSFSDMLKNLESVGVTFGGTFAGHGIRTVVPTSKITMVKFEAKS